MSIPCYLSEQLKAALAEHKVESYKPAYGGESVGLDLYNAGPDIPINKSKVLIPTGLHLNLPPNHVALLRERGSVTKSNYVLRAGVIDPGYTDQVFVNMIEPVSWFDFTLSNMINRLWGEASVIKQYQKLPVQLIITRTHTHEMNFCERDVYEEVCKSSRAARKFNKIGSSD